MTFDEALALGKSRSDCAPGNLDSLVELAREIGRKNVAGHIIECGSYQCGATIALAAAAPDRAVFALDLFGGLPYESRGFENFGNVRLEEIQKATAPFWNIILVQGMHEVTVPQINVPVSLLFLDSDHYESHAVCLKHLWPLVSPGGVIVFHDPGFAEVQRALTEDGGYGPIEEVPGSPNMRLIWKPAVAEVSIATRA